MNAIKNKEKEEDWIEIFLLIEDEEIEKVENKIYFIKLPKIKASDKRVPYFEGM